jgi:hypothetical protein
MTEEFYSFLKKFLCIINVISISEEIFLLRLNVQEKKPDGSKGPTF